MRFRSVMAFLILRLITCKEQLRYLLFGQRSGILEVVGLNVIVVLLVNRHTVYHRVNYHFQKATVVWVCGSGREIELIILLITHIHYAVNYSRPNYIIHTGV